MIAQKNRLSEEAKVNGGRHKRKVRYAPEDWKLAIRNHFKLMKGNAKGKINRKFVETAIDKI